MPYKNHEDIIKIVGDAKKLNESYSSLTATLTRLLHLAHDTMDEKGTASRPDWAIIRKSSEKPPAVEVIDSNTGVFVSIRKAGNKKFITTGLLWCTEFGEDGHPSACKIW